MNTWKRLRGSLAVTFTTRIYLFVSLVILGVVGYVLLHEQRVLDRELRARGLLTASHLAQQSVDPILREDDYALFRLIKVLAAGHREEGAVGERILYAMVLDRQGMALAHTNPVQVHRVLADPRTRQVLARPAPSVAAASGPDAEGIYDVAVPVLMRGLPIGAVRLGISRAGVERLFWDVALKVLGVLFLLMLVGIGSIWRFSRRMVQPIRQLRDGARAVQAGDLRRRVPVERPDEIGELAAAFNAMTAELERSQAELRRKEEIRLRLLEQVISAQEAERKRIARELHDETSQALTSLMVGLRMLEQRPELVEAHQTLADLRALAGKTLGSVHDLALQLRPSVLDDLGLVPAMERAVAEFQRTHGIAAAFETNLPGGSRLPATAETALYRIAQEALTNVARHAQARAVSVLVEARRGAVTLIVEDDGRGFDVARCLGDGRDERCLGLFGMRERATLLGGTLTIESTPAGGTTVYAEIPVAEGPEAPADGAGIAGRSARAE